MAVLHRNTYAVDYVEKALNLVFVLHRNTAKKSTVVRGNSVTPKRSPAICCLYHLAVIAKELGDTANQKALLDNLRALERVLFAKGETVKHISEKELAGRFKNVQVSAGSVLTKIDEMPASLYAARICNIHIPLSLTSKHKAIDTMLDIFESEDWAYFIAAA